MTREEEPMLPRSLTTTDDLGQRAARMHEVDRKKAEQRQYDIATDPRRQQLAIQGRDERRARQAARASGTDPDSTEEN